MNSLATRSTIDLDTKYQELIAIRAQLIVALANPVQEIQAPGIGDVQYLSVEDRLAQLRAIDEEISTVAGLLGLGFPRRRPIHPCAIE
jgi:hypothetical protein